MENVAPPTVPCNHLCLAAKRMGHTLRAMPANDEPMDSNADESRPTVDYGDPASVENAIAAKKRKLKIHHQVRAEENRLRTHEERTAGGKVFRKNFEAYETQFGVKLRDWRKARGWSQARVADELGYRGFEMHQTTVAKIENGTRPLRVAEAVAISDVMGMPALSVFYGPGPDDEAIGIDALRRMMERTEESLRYARKQAERAVNTVLFYESELAATAQAINLSALEFDREQESDERNTE